MRFSRHSRSGARYVQSATLALSAALCWPAAAQAQDVASDDDQGNEIIVTATKKAGGESVQNVGAAITAFGGEQLEQRFVRNLQNLSYEIPNVQLEASGNMPGYANFSIRGQGINSTIPSIEPSVGVFVDGVYMGINAGLVLDNFDLEGIEVLRGPQGVLFGKNVTGGAVLLRTTTPGQELRVNARAAIETGTNYIASASVSGPLVADRLAGKIAVYYNKDNGWFHNQADDSAYGASKQLVVRSALTFTPGGDFRLILRGEHGEIDGDGSIGQNHALFPRGSFGVSNDFRGYSRANWDQLFAEVSFGVGPGEITNIMGYRRIETRQANDVDSTPQPLFTGQFITQQHQFSNELRYAATLGPVELVTGLYYFDQKIRYLEARSVAAGTINSSGGGVLDQTTLGGFIAADWEVTDGLTINLGSRYSWEEKRASVQQIVAGGCNFTTVRCGRTFQGEEGWGAFIPKIGFQWRPADRIQVYGLYTRGFRSGGYNLRSSDTSVAPGPFDQEVQDSFEIGAKWGNSRTNLNVALFHNSIADLQREVVVPTLTGISQTIRNTADATTKGIEIDGRITLAQGLSLTGFFGYVEGKYRNVKFDISSDGVVNGADLALRLPRLSPFSYGAGIRYEVEAGGLGKIAANASIAHRDAAFFTDNNRGILPGADMVDASLSWTPVGTPLTLSVYGRNLLDEATLATDTPLAATFGGPGASYSVLQKGRVLGAEAALRF